jgi:hypothetical protein
MINQAMLCLGLLNNFVTLSPLPQFFLSLNLAHVFASSLAASVA